MRTKLLLLAILGLALILIGSLLIIEDSGSCPAQTYPYSNPGGLICYHTLFGLPMSPTGLSLVVVGIIILIAAFVLSRKR